MGSASLLKHPGRGKGLKVKVKLTSSGQTIIWDGRVLRVLEAAVQDRCVGRAGLWMANLLPVSL